MKKLLLLLMMFAGLTGFGQGNSRRISGIVYDNDDKKPLPGTTIIVTGTKIETHTDADGKYLIMLPAGSDKLSFSFIGFDKQIITVGKKDSIDVYLKQDNRQLNEVVVIGYGTKRKTSLTGSVSSVRARGMANKKDLTGKVAGVVVTGSAAPNADITIEAPVGNAVAQVMPTTAQYAPTPVINSANAGDESYSTIVENTFNDAKDKPLSTFSIDVDAASYSNVRRYINGGQLPPKDAIRLEEMINYFNYKMGGPVNNDPVAIHTELSTAPWNPKHQLVRIGLKAKTIDTSKLPPSNLVFLLDISGSMGEVNKLPLVKSAMKMLVDMLRPQDRVAIVVYSGEAGLKLASTPGDKKEEIKDAIDALEAGGSTAGGAGIKLAYKIARDNFMPKGNNRIIMATDGDFNVGDASDGDMETLITHEQYSNVPLTIMGFGMGNLKDSKMEILADKGHGNYAYIDNITEARKTLVDEFGGTLFTVAKDVKVQVEFNPAVVQAYRLIGYEDRLMNKEDFNNDQKDAGDMGSGHTVTAFYEIVPVGVKDDYAMSVDPLKYQKPLPVATGSASDDVLTVKFRYKDPTSAVSNMREAMVKNTPVEFNRTSPDFRFAASVAEFGMLIRDSQFKQKATFDQAIGIARAAKGEDEDGYRSEFVRLAESAKLLAKGN